MSAQSYTNKRRILAEASLLKTVYPGRVGVKNTLAATIDCPQSFQPLVYKDICGCGFNGRGLVRSIAVNEVCVIILSGGLANTDSNVFFDGNCNCSYQII